MAITPFKREVLVRNLIWSVNVLDKASIPYIIFFGTLLGITRELNPIDGDDDVDFWVPKSYYDKVVEILQQNRSYFIPKLVYPNRFIQIEMFADRSLVDFYFYEDRGDEFYWDITNFTGVPEPTMKETLKVPKEMIDPIDSIEWNNIQLCIPNKPEECCAYLYGENWKKPMSKGDQYKTELVDNVPKIVMIKKS